jgi:hypothetical protein
MLPAQYQIPAAIVLLLGGIVACFFGYRLFRIVLAIFGGILGALLASSIFGASDTGPMVLAAVIGGVFGAGVFFAAYFVGVAIVGAALGAVLANLALSAGDRDPHFLVVIFASVFAAVVAIYLQRYFIIVGTGFGGAWTLIVGAMALIGDRTAMAAAAAGDVWVAYPLDPAPGQRWIPIVWIVLGLIGVGVQMGVTGGEKGRVGRRKPKAET